MIPKRLELQNFLSYREVALDFDGLHVACVCGPNGAGKSSLLEAIAWCVWGQSRVNAEDDIVRQGATEAQVSFCFEHDGQTYRIIRTRRRSQTSALEFQIQAKLDGDASTFKSLTQKGVRATQQYILQQIKIDYETFVNAAYLRQGRADEFMLKRPSERKQVLADLLKLSHYDRLAEQAKDQARSYKAAVPALETFLAQTAVRVEERSQIQRDYDQLTEQIEKETISQRKQQQSLQQLKQQQQARLLLTQQLALVGQKQQHQQTTWELSLSALASAQHQLSKVESTLAQSSEIELAYQDFQDLREQEENQSNAFERYQQLQDQRIEIQSRSDGKLQQQQLRLSQLTAQLAQLTEKEQDFLHVLEKKEEISEKIARLREARAQLQQFDKTEAESAPLRQRFLQVRGEIDQAHTRLITQIELLDSQQAEITLQQSQSSELIQTASEVAHRLAHLEKRRAYQEAVRQKGIERRSFMSQLQDNQRNYETKIAQLDQTLRLLLDQPEAAHCPLCEQLLDETGWQGACDRTQTERDEVQDQIWAIREQLAVSESEIQVLRREYRELEEELASYASILESRGELKAKLASVDLLKDRLRTLGEERSQLERCLQENAYATELQRELAQIEAQLVEMGYDDRDHALVRSQVDRLRWSEIKYAEIKKAEKQLAEVRVQRSALEEEILGLEEQLAVLEGSDEPQQLRALDQQLSELDYRLDRHNQLRAAMRDARVWESRYYALQQATAQKGDLLAKVERSQTVCLEQEESLAEIEQQIEQLQQQLEGLVDAQAEISELKQKIEQGQTQREQQLSQLGRVQQQLAQLDTLEIQQGEQQKKLSDVRHKYQVYRSLAEAFGRNGIQALMIENLLPQLEAMTNQVLSRLSNHQLHVQFVTQKAGRQTNSKRNRKKNKLIDTLDILIADVRGTRPYETYSGGEAFRVNFAIRLAIARLLAMRSGTALQLLIVDEGFGTQDREGCDRLIAAIEAIAPDFACILTITHMPHFREAFQTRIDVSKDETGSHIVISE